MPVAMQGIEPALEQQGVRSVKMHYADTEIIAPGSVP